MVSKGGKRDGNGTPTWNDKCVCMYEHRPMCLFLCLLLYIVQTSICQCFFCCIFLSKFVFYLFVAPFASICVCAWFAFWELSAFGSGLWCNGFEIDIFCFSSACNFISVLWFSFYMEFLLDPTDYLNFRIYKYNFSESGFLTVFKNSKKYSWNTLVFLCYIFLAKDCR